VETTAKNEYPYFIVIITMKQRHELRQNGTETHTRKERAMALLQKMRDLNGM